MGVIDAADAPQWSERVHVDSHAPALIGSQCPSCGRRSWPGRAVCEVCGSAVVGGVSLGGSGSLLAYSTVHVPREGIPAPYNLGLIELDSGVRLHAQVRGLDARPAVPVGVQLVVPAEASADPAFWFEAQA